MLSETFQSSQPPTLSLHASKCIFPVLISLRFMAKYSRYWGLWEALSPAQVWTNWEMRWKNQQRENQNVTRSRLEYVASICGWLGSLVLHLGLTCAVTGAPAGKVWRDQGDLGAVSRQRREEEGAGGSQIRSVTLQAKEELQQGPN